ncbi:oxidoreductase [Victivallis vadensis]|uniref:2,4-dienoyl-CoA reductase-like NADH-dependent reductase (Old Yellow Enzyme family) n=1 Tax=Victivallis vadensis TaxID=172901 RepID=A0A2U1B8L4_9BACT|nr:NADH:flavin oxidoreductase [Victivallis vadensis]PVY44981.1 2,4-dienoyl-CoA reductase-like NADH-dependent reductase (Old Yellow Enzyme family) [Victivallis vadensis]
MADYPRIPSFKTTESFCSHLREINLDLELDDAILAAPESPLAQPVEYHGRRIGNRWCILPMEGWDCLPDGAPSELTRRRWLNFAASGAKLLFGCEACAVMESGRSNTRQLMITPATMPLLAQLRKDMVKLHAEKFGTADDLYIGLQLTHSGRYSHPHDDAKLESVTAYEHPLLDEKFHNSAANVVSDAEVKNIVRHFIEAAGLAKEAGFDFVDIKMAHGYLGHEFLSAFTRPGEYGGSFENRTRFFREIVEGIKREVPGIDLGMRFSIFDCLPFEKGADKVGKPMERNGIGVGNYKYAFGGDGTGLGCDLTEPIRFLELARSLGVELICTTICSPYYNPHFQRPAYYPVSDGYLPPEEPIIGAARQINAVAQLKKHFENTGMLFIGAGYTCLQEYLTQVGQAAVRAGKTDFVGIGRMVLAYPELPADTLAGCPLNCRRICRTFGDCTTAPRSGMVSGCYPLDEFYKCRPECERVKEVKRKIRES